MCAQLFSLTEFFPLVWPIPALQHHSIKASSCVYLHYSSTHAFTSIIFPLFFQLMLCRADTWLKLLIEDELWSDGIYSVELKPKEPVECHRHPKWIPHVVCIISSPNSWPTVQLETKFTVIPAASLRRSAETICTEGWRAAAPRRCKGKLFMSL